jgi:hypothetical protein
MTQNSVIILSDWKAAHRPAPDFSWMREPTIRETAAAYVCLCGFAVLLMFEPLLFAATIFTSKIGDQR